MLTNGGGHVYNGPIIAGDVTAAQLSPFCGGIPTNMTTQAYAMMHDKVTHKMTLLRKPLFTVLPAYLGSVESRVASGHIQLGTATTTYSFEYPKFLTIVCCLLSVFRINLDFFYKMSCTCQQNGLKSILGGLSLYIDCQNLSNALTYATTVFAGRFHLPRRQRR